ncbi:MAG: nitroreductase family protein [Mycetocola sp.]
MKLRKIAGKARAGLKLRLRHGSAIERQIYYSVFSDAFRRERHVVSHGHRMYTKRKGMGQHEFLLRRNIHMLEKGLTMRPRRPFFALEYIEETVRLFAQIIRADQPIVSTAVEAWARDVLEQYFVATKESGQATIDRALVAYENIEWDAESDGRSVPHAPFSDAVPVEIDSLTELAVRRKSVRWYLPKPVPREVVDNAMLVAREAPSACNRQPFTMRIFDDPKMVEAVSKIPMGTAGYGHNLPGVAVIVGDLSAFIDERDRHIIYTDGCLAGMSFILGLEAQGVASVCINWPDIVERDRRMAKLLNLAPHERVVMLIGYGYADPDGLTPFSAKRELADLRSFNQL